MQQVQSTDAPESAKAVARQRQGGGEAADTTRVTTENTQRVGLLRRPVLWWRQLRDRHPWARAVGAATLLWVVSHVGYLTVTIMSRLRDSSIPFTAALGTWRQWDTKWYLFIADQGYTATSGAPGAGNASAFFPLYPTLIHVTDTILPGQSFVAAMVISKVALLAGLAVLFRLVEHEFDAPTATRTLWYLLLFPTGFFLAAGYPASLFLLLTAGSVYAIRLRNWWTAGLLGGLACTTRSAGLLLLVPFCYDYLRHRGFRLRGIRTDALAAALIPAGLGGYMLYLHVVVGNALAFVEAQKIWGREFHGPWVSLYRSIRSFDQLQLLDGQVNMWDLVAALMMIAALTLAVVGRWRFRRDQLALTLFGAALLFLLLSFPTNHRSDPLLSADRLALEIFPAFIVFARLGERYVTFDRLYLVVGLSAQAIFLVHFLYGGWVA